MRNLVANCSMNDCPLYCCEETRIETLMCPCGMDKHMHARLYMQSWSQIQPPSVDHFQKVIHAVDERSRNRTNVVCVVYKCV